MKKDTVFIQNTPLTVVQEQWLAELEQAGFINGCEHASIPVDEAVGRITAAPVFAHQSSPSYNAAAMDGIAVRFQDLLGASEVEPVILESTKFARVNTGNAIDDIFNAVVMIEDVHYHSDGSAELISPATPWQHIRNVGEDIVATELIVPEKHLIRPIDQGALLAAGITLVDVLVAPKVVVIPTGSELVEPGTQNKPGQIIEFNSRILSGYLKGWGADVTVYKHIPDDPELLEAAIIQAIEEADIVVTNAGASAGTKDFSAGILESVGKIITHGVAIKPGKPVILGLARNTPIIGLPGYPISAVLTLKLFGRPLIYSFLGLEPPAPQTTTALMSRPVHSSMGVDHFVRVTLGRVHDELIATPSGKGAGAVMSLVRADGLLTIPSGNEGVGAGERVTIELLRDHKEVDATLVITGSHDNIIDTMANQLHLAKPRVRVSSAHVGSMGGIMAIKRGEAHMAGSHLLDEETGEYNISFIKRFLSNLSLDLITLCYREQGLIVPKGNPKNIQSFSDMIAGEMIFINRQKGAGTRLLTDNLLKQQKIDSAQLHGYDHEEYTHMNIAAAVAGGHADAGMGIRAAANALGLDFIPVTEERYDLIIPKALQTDFRVDAVLNMMRKKSSFHDKVTSLGGYDLRDCGAVVYSQ